MDELSLRNTLKGLSIPKLIYDEEVDSTNEKALGLCMKGAEEFTLLVAERQSAARGRMGRKWVTTPGCSIAFSIILHPRGEEKQNMGFFSFLGALAVCSAIEDYCDIKPQVKWPNDVLLKGRKTAGILAESSFHGETLAGVVLGIGVNFLSLSVPPPREVIFPATCLEAHCLSLPKREVFLASIVQHLIQWRQCLRKPAFIEAYRSRLAFIGEKISLIPPCGDRVEGTMMDVDCRGYLLLELENGNIKSFPAGDISVRVNMDNCY